MWSTLEILAEIDFAKESIGAINQLGTGAVAPGDDDSLELTLVLIAIHADYIRAITYVLRARLSGSPEAATVARMDAAHKVRNDRLRRANADHARRNHAS